MPMPLPYMSAWVSIMSERMLCSYSFCIYMSVLLKKYLLHRWTWLCNTGTKANTGPGLVFIKHLRVTRRNCAEREQRTKNNEGQGATIQEVQASYLKFNQMPKQCMQCLWCSRTWFGNSGKWWWYSFTFLGMHTDLIGQRSAFPDEVALRSSSTLLPDDTALFFAKNPLCRLTRRANRLAAFMFVRMRVLYESPYTDIQKRDEWFFFFGWF